MLEILDSPKHLVAMKLSGKLTAPDVTRAYEEVEKALKDNERISFFAEIDPSMTMTLEGLVKDLFEGLAHIGKLGRYHRIAVVTDNGWIAALTRVEGLVLSHMDVRVFEQENRAKAFAWATETPPPVEKVVDEDRSIHFLQTTSPDVFAYEVNGRIRERDIKSAVAELKPLLEREGKFNVLARMKDFHGFDLLSVFDDDLIRVKLKAPSKIDKYAIVGAKPWMRNFLELVNPLVRTSIRTFESDEEEAAWEWVGARQALLPE